MQVNMEADLSLVHACSQSCIWPSIESQSELNHCWLNHLLGVIMVALGPLLGARHLLLCVLLLCAPSSAAGDAEGMPWCASWAWVQSGVHTGCWLPKVES